MQEKTAEGIFSNIREEVESGILEPGAALPSIRDHAVKVGVNRNTVAAAYQKLTQAGLIESRGRGMRVTLRPFDFTIIETPALPVGMVDLSLSNPNPSYLPSPLNAAQSVLSEPPALYGTTPDNRDLLDEFERLARVDNIPFGGAMIVAGATEGMERLLADYLNPGDQVIVEDPCYMKLLYLLRSMGMTPVPVTMTQDGMDTEMLKAKLTKKTKAIVLTPRAQNPTGISCSEIQIEKIRNLLSDYPELLVIEDEHLGPLSRQPYRSTIDADRKHWAIFRSVAKFLGPDYRIAAMIGSVRTIRRMKSRRAAGGLWVSHMLQKLALAVWKEQATTDLIGQALETYQRRRIYLMQALASRDIKVMGDDGLFVWIPTDGAERIAAHLYRLGWNVRTGSDFCLQAQNGLRIASVLLSHSVADELADAIEEAFIRSRSIAIANSS